MLKIVVCVKAVPDPKQADKIKIDPVTKTLSRADISLDINPHDKHALEAALQFKEQYEAHISILSMGPPSAGKVVKECLALGADEGYLLSDRAFAGADAYATAYTLAKGIEKIGPVDLVLCGMSSSDGATEWVGPEIGVFLDMPVVTMVRELVETDGKIWQVKSNIEDGYRLVQMSLPAVLTVVRELNTPRALSFSGIIKARKREIMTWDLDALGVAAESVGEKGSPTIVSNLAYLESKRECEIIEGSLEEQAEILLQKFEEAGVM